MNLLEQVKSIDESVFLWLNSHHNAFFDFIMWHSSQFTIWLPLFAVLIYTVIKRYKLNSLVVLLFVIFLILITDQFCNASKYYFMRLRPTHEPSISNLVYTLNGYRGGYFSFYSGHSSNSFALVSFFAYILKNRPKYLIILLWIFAIVTAYSRIYLGVHYPGDIIVGMFIGILLGFLMGKAFEEIYFYFTKKTLS